MGLLDNLARLDPLAPGEPPAARAAGRRQGHAPDRSRRHAEDEAFEQFLARALAHEKVSAAAAERRTREEELARTVEAIIGRELEAEHARSWPDEPTRERYAGEVKSFAAFARDRGLGFLPARAATVAAYLIESAQPNGSRTLAQIEAAAKAIIFAHELAHHFIDQATIAATLSFIAARHAQAEAEREPQQQQQPQPQPRKGDDDGKTT